eukprot:m.233310 g.233310  ORF g.233310 m.233310 type:complete len:553 (-) comp33640_c3_seq1:146-1804(-)
MSKMVSVKVRKLVFVSVVLSLALGSLVLLQLLGPKIPNRKIVTQIRAHTSDLASLSDALMDINSPDIDLARDLANYWNVLESTPAGLGGRQLLLLACSWKFREHNFEADLWAKTKLDAISSLMCVRKRRQTCLNPIDHGGTRTTATPNKTSNMSQSNLALTQHVPRLLAPTGRGNSLDQRLRLVAYHEVFANTCGPHLTPVEYHKDGPERFIRGYNERKVPGISHTDFVRGSVPPQFTSDSLSSTNYSRHFDAVIYHAYGDDECIHTDISRANAGQLNVPVVFMMTNDQFYIPRTCHNSLIFLVVNTTQTPNISRGSTCTVYQLPNQEGENVPSDLSLSAIGERILHTNQNKDAGGNQTSSSSSSKDRSLLASFQGSMGTHESRTELLSIVAPDIVVKAVDWWGLTLANKSDSPKNWTLYREPMIVEGRMLMSDSVFALCPRGNGPSSIRFVEAIMAGAIPVLLDDFTTPFDDTLCEFAVRWTMSKPLDLLVRLLRRIARDPEQLQQRRNKMWDFVQHHHPFWFDHRFMARVIRETLVRSGGKISHPFDGTN